MSITFDSSVSAINYNGNPVSEVIWNDTSVWSSTPPDTRVYVRNHPVYPGWTNTPPVSAANYDLGVQNAWNLFIVYQNYSYELVGDNSDNGLSSVDETHYLLDLNTGNLHYAILVGTGLGVTAQQWNWGYNFAWSAISTHSLGDLVTGVDRPDHLYRTDSITGENLSMWDLVEDTL